MGPRLYAAQKSGVFTWPAALEHGLGCVFGLLASEDGGFEALTCRRQQ
jgi:hypothetical protein